MNSFSKVYLIILLIAHSLLQISCQSTLFYTEKIEREFIQQEKLKVKTRQKLLQFIDRSSKYDFTDDALKMLLSLEDQLAKVTSQEITENSFEYLELVHKLLHLNEIMAIHSQKKHKLATSKLKELKDKLNKIVSLNRRLHRKSFE